MTWPTKRQTQIQIHWQWQIHLENNFKEVLISKYDKRKGNIWYIWSKWRDILNPRGWHQELHATQCFPPVGVLYNFFSLRCCSSVGLLPPMRLWQCLHLACIASMYFITLLQRRRHRPTLFPAAAIVIVIEDPQHTQPRHRNAVKSQRERFFCSDSSLKIPVAE